MGISLRPARDFAKRIANEAPTPEAAQIDLAFQIAFSRKPSAKEIVWSAELLANELNWPSSSCRPSRHAPLRTPWLSTRALKEWLIRLMRVVFRGRRGAKGKGVMVRRRKPEKGRG